jgi:DNA cross-link repair 1A protein
MVRKLRTCTSCRGRFISASGTSEHCKKCRANGSVPIPSFEPLISSAPRSSSEERQPKRLKRPPPVEIPKDSLDISFPTKVVALQPPSIEAPEVETQKENVQPEPLNQLVPVVAQQVETSKLAAVEIIEIDDDDEMGSVCSEAESDISENLTLAQVASRSQLDEVPLAKQSPTTAVTAAEIPQATPATLVTDVHELESAKIVADNDQYDEVGIEKVIQQVPLALVTSCFICGCSFERISTGYKGRLNHIKRCSKKHGVTASDMKYNDDDEHFQASSTTTAPFNPNNPYTSTRDTWHGDAEEDLKLAGEAPGKQTTMTAFFEAPIKSLNNVLMAGAKRVSKTGDLLLAVAQKKQQSGGTAKKKGWGYSTGYNSACPAYKKISGSDFVVDGFMYTKSCTTKNFFLTHFHSDHYGGITKSWCAGVIYCSLPTANLVAQQLGVDRKYLHPLGMNSPVVIESQGKPVTVTLLDANHCPGAVMFLFQVGQRHILHVGDFRWNREKMNPDLKDFSSLKVRLDDLYLDTTYCNEKYRLPTQEVAIQAAVETAIQEVESAHRAKRRLLMLFGAYTIGKERIYLAVAEKLGLKVYVEKSRYRILSALNWPPEQMRVFTTDKETTCLWVVPLGHINFKKLSMYVDGSTKALSSKGRYDKIVGFRPTGWSLTGCNNGILSTRTSGIFTVHGVPYSEHSSFPELVDCLDCLKPKRIIPTVSVSKSDEQVELLLKELGKTSKGN